MSRKVRIKGLPNKSYGGTNRTKDGASDGLRRYLEGKKTFDYGMNQFAEPDFEVNNTIKGVDPEEANIEAEGNEIAVVPGMSGIPEAYKIVGPRHNGGGVPLNLAPDSFIFSDHKKGMKIKDGEILAEFGMTIPKKGKPKGKTPAELAKKYKINEYKRTLMDTNSDKIERETAELMIKNYNLKLAKLGLVQEAMKGFPQGIPQIAQPYIDTVGVDPNMFAPEELQTEQQQPQQPAAYGAGVIGDPMQYAQYGANVSVPYINNDEMAGRFNSLDIKQRGGQYDGAFWDSILQEGGFVPHMMYDPQSGQGFMASTIEDHLSMKSDGYSHEQKQEGGDVKDTNIKAEEKNEGAVTIPSKYKTDSYKEGSANFSVENLKKGDYYKSKDGKWHKVTYVPTTIKYEGKDLTSTFGSTDNSETIANQYAFLENTFQDPGVRAEFAKKTRAALANKEYYKRKDGSTAKMYTEEEIAKMSDDYLVDQHLNMQKRNYALQGQGYDPQDFTDRNGSLRKNLSADVKEMYKQAGITNINQAFEHVGVPITDAMTEAGDIGVQQASYFGYSDMIADRENYTPELQEKLKFFKDPKVGAGDEGQTGSTQISPIDSKANNYYTDTSAGELDWVDQGVMQAEDVTEAEAAPEEIAANDPGFVKHVPRDEWWAQDIGNIANLAGQRLGLKKYLPHSFPVDLQKPDVLYFDPSRALAANAEQANIAAQATSAYAGPQATYRQSAIQGDAFKNAANVLADYEAKNVGVGNQYLNQVAQTANQQTLANSERAQRLYDQNTVANQQFDNSKRVTTRNLFEGWRQGLTNKKMTQAMNAMYPQFETIPSIGGGLYHTGVARPFTDTGSPGGGSNNYLEEFQSLKTKYPAASDKAIQQQLDFKYAPGRPATPTASARAKNNTDMRGFMNMYSGINPFAQGAFPPGMIPQ